MHAKSFPSISEMASTPWNVERLYNIQSQAWKYCTVDRVFCSKIILRRLRVFGSTQVSGEVPTSFPEG